MIKEHSVSIRLNTTDRELALRLGDGNISSGIDAALEIVQALVDDEVDWVIDTYLAHENEYADEEDRLTINGLIRHCDQAVFEIMEHVDEPDDMSQDDELFNILKIKGELEMCIVDNNLSADKAEIVILNAALALGLGDVKDV